jgi:DNA-binding transcriptional LysR family regulator
LKRFASSIELLYTNEMAASAYDPWNQRLSHERALRFIAVVEAGSFSAAADRLGITQPTLSTCIAQFERDLGLQLLNRGKSGVNPTVFGALLYERVKGVQAELARAAKDISDLANGSRGGLVVGAVSGTATQVACAAICNLINTRPGFEIKLQDSMSETELISQLKRGSIDFGVGRSSYRSSDTELKDEHVAAFSRVFVTRYDHPLARKPKPSIADFAACSFVYPDKAEESYRGLAEIFEKLGIRHPKIGATAYSLTAAKSLVMGSDLCALLRRVSTHNEVERRMMKIYDLPLPADNGICLVRNNRRAYSPAMTLFANEFRKTCEHLEALFSDKDSAVCVSRA